MQRLYYSGQSAAAMERADQFLATKPKDPQMRFIKGVMLADAKRNAEATTLFQQLTEDYPDLAEPYNNLAALYAACRRLREGTRDARTGAAHQSRVCGRAREPRRSLRRARRAVVLARTET